MIRRLPLAIPALLAAWLVAGCAAPYQGERPTYGDPSTSPSMTEDARITTSLFDKDNAVISQEAVEMLLKGRVDLGDSLRVGVFKVAGSGRRSYYGHGKTEEQVDLEQEFFDIVSSSFSRNPRVRWIRSVPEILSPREVTLPRLRESAVRLQADLLVIYSVQSDIFTDHNLFKKDEIKAYSTVEFLVLHTRTGVVPISEIRTRKVIEPKAGDDADLSETRKRAQKKAILEALREAAAKAGEQLR